MKKYLLFGLIASVLSINSVLATSSTVTSKDYVDTQDALKQNKIPAAGTNASTPGDTVVTYTSTAGTIGERGIYDEDIYAEGGEYNSSDLVTVGVIDSVIDEIYNQPTISTSKLVCMDSPDCTLWVVDNQTVKGECRQSGTCSSPVSCEEICCNGTYSQVNDGTYRCVVRVGP